MSSHFEFDRDQLEKLDKEDLILSILALQEQVRELQQTVAKQAAEIQELRDQLAKVTTQTSASGYRLVTIINDLRQKIRARFSNVRHIGPTENRI